MLDVVVVNNGSADETRELVEAEFPQARIVACANHGFAHANNCGWMTCGARYALFLNPDTQILEGTFGELVEEMDARPTVGLVGVKQVTADGRLIPTIRRFPNAARALGEAFGSERFPFRASWLGERETPDGAVRPRDRVRLDFRLVHALAHGSLVERGLDGRAVFHLQRGARSLPAHQEGGVGDPAPALDDDPAPCGQGRSQAEYGRAGRIRSAAARSQALWVVPPKRVHRRACAPLPPALRCTTPRRRRCTRRGGPSSVCDRARPGQSAVRSAPAYRSPRRRYDRRRRRDPALPSRRLTI